MGKKVSLNGCSYDDSRTKELTSSPVCPILGGIGASCKDR